MFRLLAATGVRRSELLALEGRHLHLDGERPHVNVRQRVRRRTGAGLVIGPLKSRHAPATSRSPSPWPTAWRRSRRRTTRSCSRRQRGRAGPGQPARPGALARVRGSRGGVGRVPHFPAHVASRLFAQGRNVVPGPALAGAPLAELHARHLLPPARRRPRRTLGGAAALYRQSRAGPVVRGRVPASPKHGARGVGQPNSRSGLRSRLRPARRCGRARPDRWQTGRV